MQSIQEPRAHFKESKSVLNYNDIIKEMELIFLNSKTVTIDKITNNLFYEYKNKILQYNFINKNLKLNNSIEINILDISELGSNKNILKKLLQDMKSFSLIK